MEEREREREREMGKRRRIHVRREKMQSWLRSNLSLASVLSVGRSVVVVVVVVLVVANVVAADRIGSDRCDAIPRQSARC